MNYILSTPDFLYLNLLIPVLILRELWGKSTTNIGIPTIVGHSLPASDITWKIKLRTPLILFFRCFTIALFSLALARPQYGLYLADRTSEARDLLISVDVSGSMRALDFEIQGQTVSRLDALKGVVASFIKSRMGDRLGLLVFGTETFTQCPLTLDQNLLLQYLNDLEVGMAGDSTALGDAILLSAKRLSNIKSPSKAIILVTDGLKSSGQTEPVQSAEIAKRLNIKIYTIGIGGNGMAPFAVTDMLGREIIVYKEVPMDEETLKAVAKTTGGKYFNAKNTDELVDIYKEIDTLEMRKEKAPQFITEKEFADYLIPIGLCILFVAEILSRSIFRVLS